jgi:hypothetical protein
MRCKGDAVNELCPKHLAEWEAAGKPPLDSLKVAPAAKGGDSGLTPAQEAALVLRLEKLTKGLQMAQALPLDTPQQRERAVSIINQARADSKALDKDRKELVDPLNQVVKKINARHKEVMEVYDAIADAIESRLGQWKLAAEAARNAALKAIAEAPAAAAPEAYVAAHESLALPSNAGAESVVWNYRVVDEKRLPDYCFKRVIDHDAIAAICKTAAKAGTTPQIPGCEFQKEIRVAAGRVG